MNGLLRTAWQSSKGVAALRSVTRDAVILAPVRWLVLHVQTLWRALLPVRQALAVDVQWPEGSPEGEFNQLPELMYGSFLRRAGTWVMRVSSLDWRGSAAARCLQRAQETLSAYDVVDRVRLVGVTLFAAIAVHLSMTGMSASAFHFITVIVWGALLVFSLVLALAARGAVAAWVGWRRHW